MKSFDSKAHTLAGIADRFGMYCKDVVRYPDMLRGSRLKQSDLTSALIGHAEQINRSEFQSLLEKYSPRKPLTKSKTEVKLFGFPVAQVASILA